MEQFMLSNFPQAKMCICIDKIYQNKVNKNNHMRKIHERVEILVVHFVKKNVYFPICRQQLSDTVSCPILRWGNFTLAIFFYCV